MKRYFLPVVVLVLLVLIVFAILKASVLKTPTAGLQVNSLPQSTVYLDGKEVGKTPYDDIRLGQGEKTLRLVYQASGTNTGEWETKIKLNSGTLSLVNREFGEDEASSQGEIITLEPVSDKKTASMAIISQPDSSLVKLDGEAKGFTPIFLDKLTKGEHEVIVSSPDFLERKFKTKLFDGFKTTVNVKLAQVKTETIEVPSISPSPVPTLGKNVSPTPTPKVSPQVTPKVTSKVTPTTGVAMSKPYVKILETPTGWLRVRETSSTAGAEVARVNPGEEYSLLDEITGWYKIAYAPDKEGWISSQYAQKFE